MAAIVNFFETKITPPKAWGAYHLCCLAVVAVLTAVIFACGRKLRADRGLSHKITCVAGGILIFIELLKNLFYGLEVAADGSVYWDYPWQIFPFQFCSTPMYVCFVLMFTKQGKFREALNAFLATYGAFGGAVVLLHPNSVLVDFLFIDIHTMLWHGTLFLLGALQWGGGTFRFRLSSYLGETAVFLVLVAVALTLNLSLKQLSLECGFNMFYISPYVPCTILFMVKIWEVAPYPVFLAVYVLGFALIALAIFYVIGIICRAIYGNFSYACGVPFRRPRFHISARRYRHRSFAVKRKRREQIYWRCQ